MQQREPSLSARLIQKLHSTYNDIVVARRNLDDFSKKPSLTFSEKVIGGLFGADDKENIAASVANLDYQLQDKVKNAIHLINRLPTLVTHLPLDEKIDVNEIANIVEQIQQKILKDINYIIGNDEKNIFRKKLIEACGQFFTYYHKQSHQFEIENSLPIERNSMSSR